VDALDFDKKPEFRKVHSSQETAEEPGSRPKKRVDAGSSTPVLQGWELAYISYTLSGF
jgi:hypothetical protein